MLAAFHIHFFVLNLKQSVYDLSLDRIYNTVQKFYKM